jgi:hypothetical protein
LDRASFMQEHGDIEFRAAARGMGYAHDVSAASRSDLAEMIAAGVVEGGGVHVRGGGRGGGKGSGRKGKGSGTGRSSARGRVGRAVRGRGRTTGLRGPQNTPTGSRGRRTRAGELAGFAEAGQTRIIQTKRGQGGSGRRNTHTKHSARGGGGGAAANTSLHRPRHQDARR